MQGLAPMESWLLVGGPPSYVQALQGVFVVRDGRNSDRWMHSFLNPRSRDSRLVRVFPRVSFDKGPSAYSDFGHCPVPSPQLSCAVHSETSRSSFSSLERCRNPRSYGSPPQRPGFSKYPCLTRGRPQGEQRSPVSWYVVPCWISALISHLSIEFVAFPSRVTSKVISLRMTPKSSSAVSSRRRHLSLQSIFLGIFRLNAARRDCEAWQSCQKHM